MEENNDNNSKNNEATVRISNLSFGHQCTYKVKQKKKKNEYVEEVQSMKYIYIYLQIIL